MAVNVLTLFYFYKKPAYFSQYRRGLRFESRWGRGLFILKNIQTGPVAAHRPVNGHLLYFAGLKRPGREINHSPPSSA